MTRKDKRRFIRALFRSVADGLLADIPKMPEDWDGVELRRLVADRFYQQMMCTDDRGRTSRYNRVRLERNL